MKSDFRTNSISIRIDMSCDEKGLVCRDNICKFFEIYH